MGKQMKGAFFLNFRDRSDLRIRSITQNDAEDLRVWKNNNRNSFFYKQEILPEEQAKWYHNYLLREDDYIFIVEVLNNDTWEKIGCLGFRVVEGTIDLYNVIRGRITEARSSMREAMHILLAYISARYSYPIKCDVLVDNPAVEWYNKCGFSIKECRGDYYIMVFDKDMVTLPDVDEEEI